MLVHPAAPTTSADIVGEHALGTPESWWRESLRLAACAPMLWGHLDHVVVLAPHPDDEVLAVGGTMFELARRGTRVSIIAITDGEASHPRSSTTPAQMASRRAVEREHALAQLHLDRAVVTRLRYPDGHVAKQTRLASRLMPLIRGASLVLAPWERDGQPDHDATGSAAALAAEISGIRLVRYPVWAWHWAEPSADELPWASFRRVPLSDAARSAKRAAIAEYVSQITSLDGDAPILSAAVLARFHRAFEVVFV